MCFGRRSGRKGKTLLRIIIIDKYQQKFNFEFVWMLPWIEIHLAIPAAQIIAE